MHPTTPRLVRLIPLTRLPAPLTKLVLEEQARTLETAKLAYRKRTLIDALHEQKEEVEAKGGVWPANLRMERQLGSAAFKQVKPELRGRMKRMMKER